MTECYSGNGSVNGQEDYYLCSVPAPREFLFSCAASIPVLGQCHDNVNAAATDKTMGKMEFVQEFWSLDSGKAGSGSQNKCTAN
jgi:hypothetical protein